MTIQIINCEQGTDEWRAARLGIPTASQFQVLLREGRGGGESKTRAKYLRQLAGEIITGEPMETYSNGHMERGKSMEAEARSFYAFMHDAEPQTVGFVRNGAKGCSPDSLVGSNRALEIKTKLPDLLIECIVRGDMPPEHKAQCQGTLLVTERDEIDFVAYWPKMPLFVWREHRDPKYIMELSRAIDEFNDELYELVEKIKGYAK